MSSLKDKNCVPCEDAKPEHILSTEVVAKFLLEVKDWKLDHMGKSISRDLKFPNFTRAMSFVDSVADIAEEEGHHPDIFISYDTVKLTLSTHSVGGLTENDFIVASRIDNLWLM